jgi:signal transduction histidine kinase
VTIGELLGAVSDRYGQAATRADRRLVVDSDGGAVIRGDPLRLQQALANLLDNALRYGRGTISLSARARGGVVEVHVTDEGPGFPDQFVAFAFERFSRADRARGRGGAGLGLAIVDAIARAHGGEAHAANRPDGGADVWLALPATTGATSDSLQPAAGETSPA